MTAQDGVGAFYGSGGYRVLYIIFCSYFPLYMIGLEMTLFFFCRDTLVLCILRALEIGFLMDADYVFQ